MRRAAKIDANQVEIVEALRSCGFSVQHLHAVGKGCPDLLCGRNGVNYLVEVKDGKKPPSARRLTDDQMTWYQAWRGDAPHVLTSVDDALAMAKWAD